jgi:crossover junction endodeoxyribonuclease RuvC
MKIIAIDPGYDRVGVAILEKTGNSSREILVHSECFVTDRKASLDERIYVIGQHILFLIGKYNPELLCIESLFFTSNQKTVMGVAESRGVIKYVGRVCNLQTVEYTPLQIKMAITGDGRADKTRIAMMVPKLIDMNMAERQSQMGGKSSGIDDEVDAIALGLTYFAYNKIV